MGVRESSDVINYVKLDRSKQRGAVLVVSLIMLAVMTLFVISMLKTSIIELRIGGASQVAALNFANAEMAIEKFIVDNDGRFAPGFLTLAVGAGGVINDPPTGLIGGTATLAPVQIVCGPPDDPGTMIGASALMAVIFDIRATATGTLGGTAQVHQGVQTFAPPGSC